MSSVRSLFQKNLNKKQLVVCYWFKNLVKMGVKIIDFKIKIGRTVLQFSCKTSVFWRAGCSFWVKKRQFVDIFEKTRREGSRWAPGAIPVCPPSFTPRYRPPTQLVVKKSEVSEWVKWVKWSNFWVFKNSGSFICYRGCLNLNCYIGKKVQKSFLMGLKNWWSWGSRFFFQNPQR